MQNYLPHSFLYSWYYRTYEKMLLKSTDGCKYGECFLYLSHYVAPAAIGNYSTGKHTSQMLGPSGSGSEGLAYYWAVVAAGWRPSRPWSRASWWRFCGWSAGGLLWRSPSCLGDASSPTRCRKGRSIFRPSHSFGIYYALFCDHLGPLEVNVYRRALWGLGRWGWKLRSRWLS
jgi:hypothetical protein